MTRPIVFFIDDEPNILQAILRITRHEHYQVATFNDPLKALAELATREVAVVIADQRIPGMTGTELLEKVSVQSPNTICYPVMLKSAQSYRQSTKVKYFILSLSLAVMMT
jgi:response regulator RpfG family c-di-GMP phosphodiesterase